MTIQSDTRKYHYLHRKILFSVVSLFFLAASPVFAGNKPGAPEEARKVAEAIGDFTIEQKDAATAKALELIDFLDKKITSWENHTEENWNELRHSSQKYYRISSRKMRKFRNEVSEWYGSMKYSSRETWEDVKRGFSYSYSNTVEALNEFEQKMKKAE